jgi:hypothetical protein
VKRRGKKRKKRKEKEKENAVGRKEIENVLCCAVPCPLWPVEREKRRGPAGAGRGNVTYIPPTSSSSSFFSNGA